MLTSGHGSCLTLTLYLPYSTPCCGQLNLSPPSFYNLARLFSMNSLVSKAFLDGLLPSSWSRNVEYWEACASGLLRQASVSGNHTGESRFGLTDRKVSRKVGNARLGISAWNWERWVWKSWNRSWEEVRMNHFSGWAGFGQTAVEAWGRSQLGRGQAANISGSAPGCMQKDPDWTSYLKRS